MEHQTKNTNIQAAFDALFNEPAPAYKTPWEKWNMSYDEWHKMYVKACDDAVEFRRNPDPDRSFHIPSFAEQLVDTADRYDVLWESEYTGHAYYSLSREQAIERAKAELQKEEDDGELPF